ncbi:hypothetical protein ABK040_008029 [Willaertia magna]
MEISKRKEELISLLLTADNNEDKTKPTTNKSLREMLIQQRKAIESLRNLTLLEDTGISYDNITEIVKDSEIKTGEEGDEFVVVDTLQNTQISFMHESVKQISRIDDLGHLSTYFKKQKVGKSQKMKRLVNKKQELINCLEDTLICALTKNEEQHNRIEELEKKVKELSNNNNYKNQ